ncbi:hypothetical protein FTX61_17150 [Nitriliruptoraceae bacterium ZYF776]|nr:hypothetical protein [Profundirhabdus halotolerans]
MTAGTGPRATGADGSRGPGTGIWIAWTLALVGGLAVLAAAFLVVRSGSSCAYPGACLTAPSTVTTLLTFGGTGLAVVGGTTATVLTVRRFAGSRRR